MGAALYQNGLVVSGGYKRLQKGGGKVLNSVEFYRCQINEWKSIATLNENRGEHALVCCEGCLYALGGCCGSRWLSSAEKLCSLDGKWKYINPMQSPRKEFAAVNCEDIIYAIGGLTESTPLGVDPSSLFHEIRFGLSFTKTVEKYVPATKRWSYVQDMHFERYGHSACVLGGKIYVVGGRDQSGEVVTEIECYDPSTDRWTIVENTNLKFFGHSVVVI